MPIPDMPSLLKKMVEMVGSDLYIAAGMPPKLNVEGKLHDLSDEKLSVEDCRQLIRQMISEEQWAEFYQKRELNVAYSLRELSRFRVNVYFQRGSVASVIRRIRMDIPDFASLRLSPILGKMIMERQGMLLVTGATGSGKSTTMAAMIDFRAANMEGHIVTVEDPIEFVFNHKKSLVTQREVGIDTISFQEALKNTLRQAPNVIFIGELRDVETVQFALHSAETGHLVLATLHSTNAPQTVERILNFFPKDYFQQILMQLSYNLRAIISQRLLPSKTGMRIPILEILVNSALVQEIIQKGELGQLKKVMDSGKQEGMQTFDGHLKELVEKGDILEEVALKFADSPSDLRLRLRGFESGGY